MDELTTTQGIVALAAAGVAVVALILAIVLAFKLRRLRGAQRAVLGDGARDLVVHAAALQEGFIHMRDWVEESIARFERRMHHREPPRRRVAYRSLVRYDAYNEMSGPPVQLVALLDARRTGVVVSADPPPRPGPALRQAGARGRGRDRALARGAGSGGHGAWPARPRAPDARRLPRTVGHLREEALRTSAPPGVEEVPYATV